MKIYRISKTLGGNINVHTSNFWSHNFYLEEVYNNIVNERFSLSKEEIPIVQKSIEMPNAVFIMDGHHRIIEGILNGKKSFDVYWNPDYPYIDAGIGNDLPVDKVNVVQFLQQKSS
ncbi:MAG TPA: hypothetical protein VMX17_10710 [Candidatus Glassbacteria bacterium]|nr:hypothetical protein [Candidatus Glassbacteria bacterium]